MTVREFTGMVARQPEDKGRFLPMMDPCPHVSRITMIGAKITGGAMLAALLDHVEECRAGEVLHCRVCEHQGEMVDSVVELVEWPDGFHGVCGEHEYRLEQAWEMHDAMVEAEALDPK